ncbi:MAG TPA: RNA pseudouridine synthase [Candidatus Krumholzibacteria bacterium]|nr:RNA pseudouridine synthase [Candidatus Krumholzibacteria bacterium]
MRTVKRGNSGQKPAPPAPGAPLTVLFDDNHVLGIVKPAGLLAQGDRTGDPTALELAKAFIRERYGKPGNVFLGLVHRIDRPVSGVMIFARTSKAASRLSRAFHDRVVEKTYLAVVLGTMPEETGELTGFVARTHLRSRLAADGEDDAREATLRYRVLGQSRLSLPSGKRRPAGSVVREVSLLDVTPRTGRHHQIRLQLSATGHPILGDIKYRAPEALPGRMIALHAARLSFPHPVREETVTIAAPPPPLVPWSLFTGEIARYIGAFTTSPEA